jgi:hypothetical protein
MPPLRQAANVSCNFSVAFCMFKSFEITAFLLITIGIVCLSLLQINGENLLYGIALVLFYLAFVLTLIYTGYKLFRQRNRSNKNMNYKPISVGLGASLILVILHYLIATDGGKKTILKGGASHDINFLEFNLFSDSSFRFINSGPFGGKIIRGKYSLNNDTLIFHSESLRYLFPQLKLRRKMDNDISYFESIDSLNYKESLFIYQDNLANP